MAKHAVSFSFFTLLSRVLSATIPISQIADGQLQNAAATYTLTAPSTALPSALETNLGAVTSEKAECTEIGLNMLKAGGNAADAMIANVFCVGTVAAYHAGIGGGGFALVRSANGSKEFINFRESAPAAAFPNMFNQNVNLSLYGGLAR